MASRLDLHEKLCEILGSRNVYFQPPESVRLSYPCIIYSRSNVGIQYADGITYCSANMYSVRLVYADPDSDLPEKILMLPHCSFDRHYKAEEMNHDVFNLYH